MKKKLHGPSLYYASDKNLYDALNQHKIDLPTISKLFLRRNTIVSKKTSREDLARSFSMLNHDYYDHQRIGDRLGVATRRERTSATLITGISKKNNENISDAAKQLKEELEATGDVVHVSRKENGFRVTVQYSTVDYSKNELSQLQTHDGVIELIEADGGFVVSSTQNDYINNVKEGLINKIQKNTDIVLGETKVSLFSVPDPKLRSKFFDELTKTLPGYKRLDVTDVYVFKSAPDSDLEDDLVEIDTDGTHVERVFLKGKGVTRSELLSDLLNREDYYIVKIRWTAQEIVSIGDKLEIEAVFANPSDCTDFSFILVGVYPVEEGGHSSKKRSPRQMESDIVSKVIEKRARELMDSIIAEYSSE